MRETPLRCVSGDMAVWESHYLLDGIDYFGLVVVCDVLVSDAEMIANNLNPVPAWKTKPKMFTQDGCEISFADQWLRPIRPHDPERKKNDKILELQIQRQHATGVIAC